MTQKILVVEDEPKIAKLLLDYLKAAGYRGFWVDDGAAAVPTIQGKRPDLILLDLMLPNKDGMTICKEVRAFSDVPIIMLTARVEEIDRLLGLELGADDYVCKPFSPREVMARVKTVLRRFNGPDQLEAESPIVIDLDRREVRAGGQLLTLTPNEFNLLNYLLKNKGRVFSRDQLLDAIYDDFRDVSDRTIDSHIKNLRKKLGRALPGRELIMSIYGVGYKLELGA
ncbi:MAG: response regulator [Acidobacteriota bacterium]|nr:response regulator [Acidobacteriota bacterium]